MTGFLRIAFYLLKLNAWVTSLNSLKMVAKSFLISIMSGSRITPHYIVDFMIILELQKL